MPARLLTFARVALLLPLVVLEECPLESSTPIAEASTTAFDRDLVGVWRCIPDGDKPAGTLSISQVTPTKLFVRLDAPGESPDSVWFHSAKSGKTKLVNFEEFGGDSKTWGLAQLVLLRPHVLQLRIGMGKLTDTDTGKVLRKVVERTVREDHFALEQICARVPKNESP